ncbi:hypothetical protein WY02_05685 [Pseudonocardia sp. AL041005-10]|nr:hypothetical protein WY02_05685 [Pseudonocardia sp. AL041005-10]
MHHIHSRLTGESPWGWRDAQVVAADGHVLHLAYVVASGRPRVWHHAPLAPQHPPGTLVRLHERHSVLGAPRGWIHISVENGVGPVPDPDDPDLWTAEQTHGAVDLATGTGLAWDHLDEEEQ